jgi:hypothetical protein
MFLTPFGKKSPATPKKGRKKAKKAKLPSEKQVARFLEVRRLKTVSADAPQRKIPINKRKSDYLERQREIPKKKINRVSHQRREEDYREAPPQKVKKVREYIVSETSEEESSENEVY